MRTSLAKLDDRVHDLSDVAANWARHFRRDAYDIPKIMGARRAGVQHALGRPTGKLERR